MINWKYPKRGELPDKDYGRIVYFNKHRLEMCVIFVTNRAIKFLKEFNRPWVYMKEFPWPEDSEESR